jgi:mRNA interferase MazF
MKRSEIWLINLDPTIGSEIRKIRPAIIVNDDDIGVLPLKIIVPITDWKDRYTNVPWMVRIEPDKKNGLLKSSCADTFQVRSLSEERFVRRLGQTNDSLMQEINKALALVLKI